MSPVLVRRFNRTERWAHWVNALGFLVCLATGLMIALKEHLGLEGEGLERTRDIHLVAAGVFVIGPLAIWLIGHTPSLLRWICEALRWSWTDIVWLIHPVFKIIWWPLKIPTAERFNAGQKINMIGMTILKWTFLASGLQMWLGQGSLLAYYVHLSSFFLSLPLLGGHVFMAALNPRTNHAMHGMTTGWVREEWARHHHGKWLERDGEWLERRVVLEPLEDRRIVMIPSPQDDVDEQVVEPCEPV